VEKKMFKRLVNLVPAISLAVVMLGSHPVAASAAVTVVGTINGGGTALMTSGPGAGGKSVSSFGFHATLYSDGTASGHVDCVDQMGDTATGNIFGDVTRWSMGPYGLTLFVTGKEVVIPGGHPFDVHFPVTIQTFGGAGVGHWTLGNPASPFCIELLLSGQIVGRMS
jgi:hypothetical protein